MSIAIREMRPPDIPVCRLLLFQLGYDLTLQEVKRRYGAIQEKQDHAVFVGEQDGQVVALLHVYERPAFDKPPEVIVQALIVDQNCRGAGVGKTMMNVAEHWAANRGFSSVALTSSASRSGAHSFYERIGYKAEAASHLFRKYISTGQQLRKPACRGGDRRGRITRALAGDFACDASTDAGGFDRSPPLSP